MKTKLITLLALLACGCAMRQPASTSDHDRALEAMAREFPRDANLYQLATIDEVEAPGRKVARFEKAGAQGQPPVWRTQIAFCVSGEPLWKCMGPWTGARVSIDGSTYSALAPPELDDATLVAIFSYIGSECFAVHTATVGVKWHRGLIRSVEREANTYVVQMAGPKGFHLIILEATPSSGSGCAFQLRRVSSLGDTAP
jgi:hypothetical protein